MAQETELAERTIRKHLRNLEGMGLIRTQQRKTAKGQRSNGYTLLLNGPPASESSRPPADDSETGGTKNRAPRQDMPGLIEEPSGEPSMNLLVGVAPACMEGARRLIKDIGTPLYQAWFGDAVIEEGPPVSISTPKLVKANWLNQQLRRAVEQAFGKDVVVRHNATMPSARP
jgi:hypothetical protein